MKLYGPLYFTYSSSLRSIFRLPQIIRTLKDVKSNTLSSNHAWYNSAMFLHVGGTHSGSRATSPDRYIPSCTYCMAQNGAVTIHT